MDPACSLNVMVTQRQSPSVDGNTPSEESPFAVSDKFEVTDFKDCVRIMNSPYTPKVWDWYALILPLVAISPLLYLQSIFLMEKEHLQFFPLAFAAVGWFFYHEGFLSPRTTTSLFRSRFAFVFSSLGIVLSGLSLFSISPWLAHLSVVVLIFGWAFGRFSSLSPLRVLGICGLILVTVPAPAGWDHILVQQLQSLSSTICSELMNITGILHVKRGNIIEILSKPLFVEEACSGVDSQYALMAVAGILLLIGRSSLIVSLITIVTVPIWAILGNLLRIYLIVIGLEIFGIDLSVGTSHTVLGLAVFMFAAWAHWSSVQLLIFLQLRLFPGTSSETQNQIFHDVSFDPKYVQTYPCGMKNTWWLMIPIAIAMLMPIGIFAVLRHHHKQVPTISDAIAELFPGEKDLPRVMDSQNRVYFRSESRSRRNLLGQHSRTWTYNGLLGLQVASLDMPFRGWHPLWECYLNAGWKRSGTTEIDVDDQGKPLEFPFFETTLENQEGDFGVLHFSLFDENGRPYGFSGNYDVLPQGNRFGSSILNFLTEDEPTREPLTFQFQLLSKTDSVARPEQISDFRRQYLRLRGLVYSKSIPVVKNLKGL